MRVVLPFLAMLMIGTAYGVMFGLYKKDKKDKYIIAAGLAKVQKLGENVFVQPGVWGFVTPIWYKHEDKQWFWTPFKADQVHVPSEERWIPVSTIYVPRNIRVRSSSFAKAFLGQSPAPFNIKIIKYLDENNPDPASFQPVIMYPSHSSEGEL